jgi:hypothetical protein
LEVGNTGHAQENLALLKQKDLSSTTHGRVCLALLEVILNAGIQAEPF